MEERKRNERENSEEDRNATNRQPSQAEGSEETVDQALQNDDLAPKEPPD